MLFILVSLGLLLLVAWLIEWRLYLNTRDGFFSRQADWHLTHPTPMPVLFIGNSRISWHVNMPQLVSHYKVPMYCLTTDARSIPFFWYKFKTYIERNPLPKAIVLQCDLSSLTKNGMNQNTFYFKEKYLSYLLFDRLGINHYFENEKGYYAYETFIPLVRYIHFPEYALKHWRNERISPYATPGNYGSKQVEPIPNFKLPALNHANQLKKASRVLEFNYIDSFMDFCLKHDIRLLCIYPPQSYASYQSSYAKYRQSFETYFQSRQLQNRHFSGPEFSADSLFVNHLHLNKNGSNLFTQQLIAYLDSLQIPSLLTKKGR